MITAQPGMLAGDREHMERETELLRLLGLWRSAWSQPNANSLRFAEGDALVADHGPVLHLRIQAHPRVSKLSVDETNRRIDVSGERRDRREGVARKESVGPNLFVILRTDFQDTDWTATGVLARWPW